MKNIRLIGVFILVVSSGTLQAASLLQPTSFPKTAEDLSFIQDVQLQQDGYEPWETLYDTDGRCISGCLYPGITIDEDIRIAQEHTAQAWARAQQYLNQQQSQNTEQPVQQISEFVQSAHEWTQPQQPLSQPVKPRCSPVNSSIPENQIMPFGMPLLGNPRITSRFGSRIHPVTGQPSTHKGVDFSASIGTSVFSPASGIVSSVWTDSSCGNGLKIKHSNKYETVYCHLSKVTVRKGERVEAGCKVAETGNSGRTTGPHLHYGIKEDGDYVDPQNWVNAKR